jgi:hypothetical protein
MPLFTKFLAGALSLGLSACALGAAERSPSLSDPSNPEAPESPPYRLATLSGLGTRPIAEAPPAEPAPGGSHAGHGAPAPAPSAPDAGTPAATVYTCPMHPEVMSHEPGRCPQCGMKLVPREPPSNGEAR